MKLSNILLLLITLLSAFAFALQEQEMEPQDWSHAEIHYGDINQLNQEMQEFFDTQSHIKHVITDIPQAQLRMFEVGKDTHTEVLFPGYVDAGLVQNILSDKKLYKRLGSDDL